MAESLAEKYARYDRETKEVSDRFLSFLKGAAKAVTTDIPGFLMDVADKLAGDTKVLGEKDRSSQLFNSLTGAKKSETEGDKNAETLGGLTNPLAIMKAVFVPALLTKSMAAVKEAENMVKAGKAASPEMYLNTGIFQSPSKDNILRAVMPDNMAGLNQRIPLSSAEKGLVTLSPGYELALPDVLRHDELYKAIPELRNVSVIQMPGAPKGNASFRNDKGQIALGGFSNLQDMTSAILHEVQHGIQYRFGMDPGGSPMQFFAQPRQFREAKKALLEKQDFLREVRMEETSPKAKAQIDNAIEGTQVDLSLLEQASAKARNDYMKLTGEAEARAVENMFMNSRIPDLMGAKRIPLAYYDVDPTTLISSRDPKYLLDRDPVIKAIIESALANK